MGSPPDVIYTSFGYRSHAVATIVLTLRLWLAGKKAYSVKRDEKAIMTELMTNGPVEAALSVYEDLLHYKSGAWRGVAWRGVAWTAGAPFRAVEFAAGWSVLARAGEVRRGAACCDCTAVHWAAYPVGG